MKNTKILSIGLLALILSACGGDSKLEAKEQNIVSEKVEKVETANADLKKTTNLTTQEVLLGVDYKELEVPVELEGLGNNSVIEIFWLGCPHCQNFEPSVRKWKLENSDVNFVKMHAMTDSPRWLIDSTVYNALVLSGGTDENVNGLFDLYTKKMQDYQSAPADNKPSAYPKIKDIYDFIESQNVDLAKFQSNMSSDEMKDIQKRDRKIFEDSKLGGVPAFIVNNKYLITGTDVKSYDEYFEKVSAVLKKTNK